MSLAHRIRRRLARIIQPPEPPRAEPPPAPPPGVLYAEDGLWTQHPGSFLDDPQFQSAYAAGKATGSWWDHDLRWRAHVICWAAKRGAALEGDFVECGVHRGGYSRMLAEVIGLKSLTGRKLYLVDTYHGIPLVDGPRAEVFNRHYDDCYDEVVETFALFDNAVVVRGAIPGILAEVVPDRVCYLSIDLNSLDPSIAALEHFWPRMITGGVVVLDDYNFVMFNDLQAACDAFAVRSGAPLLSLPTGQGLLIKP